MALKMVPLVRERIEDAPDIDRGTAITIANEIYAIGEAANNVAFKTGAPRDDTAVCCGVPLALSLAALYGRARHLVPIIHSGT